MARILNLATHNQNYAEQRSYVRSRYYQILQTAIAPVVFIAAKTQRTGDDKDYYDDRCRIVIDVCAGY